jgi:hypothetical protein
MMTVRPSTGAFLDIPGPITVSPDVASHEAHD